MLKTTFRQKLRDRESTCGLWVTLESPNVTEAAVELGFDWVVIDMEHGHLDWCEVINHVRVADGTGTATIVRVSEVQQGTIKRALDVGAQGVILPMVGDRKSTRLNSSH